MRALKHQNEDLIFFSNYFKKQISEENVPSNNSIERYVNFLQSDSKNNEEVKKSGHMYISVLLKITL
jgi:hypothetical protein